MTALLVAAFGLLAAAGLADLTAATANRRVQPLPYLAGLLASLLLAVVGAAGIAGHPARIGLGTFFGFGPATLTVDRLSGLFLVVSFAVAAPVCLACAGWARATSRSTDRVPGRGLGAAFALTLGAVAVVLTADNAFCFLFGWEGLTVAFYLLTAHDRQPAGRGTASIVTVVFGKASGAFLLVGFLLLASRAGTFSLPALASLPPSASRDAGFGLLVAGFAVKVGIVPVHGWMPRGYRAAPGPLRAIMAAVAVNAGFYGMWRTLGLLHTPPGWLMVAALLLGGLTAILGIAHATVQTDLAEVIAYSSVENGGLITVGYGVALAGAALHLAPLTAVGLLAGTLQVVAHALAKALLFTSAAGIEVATGTTALDRLRGVGHRLPYSGTGLAVGSLTLAGLPLTVGFVSEWFLLEALMQQFRAGRLGYSLAMAAAGALVALTAGFASVAFVRIVGLVVLAPRRGDRLAVGPDVRAGGRAAVALLSVGCLAVAAVTPLEARMIAAGLDPVVPRAVTGGALRSPWVLQPVYPGFSILSPSWL
ncbi:MAG TPA: proton-conducting transporter membrane subunit, partial [Mycobacteriales bacterium]|nr:proton-conducting transporter membrane subunit [Mycobacteriales bacterium]